MVQNNSWVWIEGRGKSFPQVSWDGGGGRWETRDTVRRATGYRSEKGKSRRFRGVPPLNWPHPPRLLGARMGLAFSCRDPAPQSNWSNLSLILKIGLRSYAAFVLSEHPETLERVVLSSPRGLPRIMGRTSSGNGEELIWEARPLTARTRSVTREATWPLSFWLSSLTDAWFSPQRTGMGSDFNYYFSWTEREARSSACKPPRG